MLDSSALAHRSHRGRPTPPLELSAEDRRIVEIWLRGSSLPQGEARRAQALLLFADGVPITDVGKMLGINERTAFKWRARFNGSDPVAAIKDAPKPGRPVSLFQR